MQGQEKKSSYSLSYVINDFVTPIGAPMVREIFKLVLGSQYYKNGISSKWLSCVNIVDDIPMQTL
jgi:hypothetical protein